LSGLFVRSNIFCVGLDGVLSWSQASLNGFGRFQIVRVEVNGFRCHPALRIADAIYRDPEARDEDGG
jgi:hypothetical protein